MIIINTPHNPTGTVMNAFDMAQLDKITRGTDIVIISDEVYEHIIFDGIEHQSVLRFPKVGRKKFCNQLIWQNLPHHRVKVGYCIAPKNLTTEFRKVHQF